MRLCPCHAEVCTVAGVAQRKDAQVCRVAQEFFNVAHSFLTKIPGIPLIIIMFSVAVYNL
jgi:hypothetical protein